MPLPSIIWACRPSSAIGVQTAGATRCSGIEISLTLAPSALNRFAAFANLFVDVALAIGMTETFGDDADLHAP